MSPFKSGLHKRISSIFDGVPVNGKDNPGGLITQQTQPDLQVSRSSSKQNDEQNQQQTSRNLYKDAPEKTNKLNVKVEKKTANFAFGLFDKLKNKLLPSQPGINRTRQLASVILIPILCVIMIIVYIKVFTSGSPKKKVVESASSQTKSVAASGEIIWQVPEPVSENVRDPMRASSYSYSGSKDSSSSGLFGHEGQIILRGIVYSSEKPLAIIGHQIVGEGEKIGDFSVLKINEHEVEVEKNGQRKILKVGQSWVVSE